VDDTDGVRKHGEQHTAVISDINELTFCGWLNNEKSLRYLKVAQNCNSKQMSL
jgi:hypothetical protein